MRLLTRQTFGRALALTALALAAYGAYGLSFISHPEIRDAGAFYLLLASLLFMASLALHPQPQETLEVAQVEAAPLRPRHWMSVVLGVVLIFAFAEINAQVFREFFNLRDFLPISENFQFMLLAGGCLALAWGFSGGWSLRRPETTELMAVIGVTLLALLLRVPNLERAIPGFVDEVSFSANVPAFEYDDEIFIAQPINSVAAFPRIYVYFQWLSIEVFGQDLNAFRLPSALFGALTAPALYWLCKHLFRRRDLAFIAALLLATLPVHIQFSRVGMNNPGDPFFGVLGFALLARGVRYGGRANFALAGVSLGLAQYFHEAGRLAFPVLAALWLLLLFLRTRQLSLRSPFARNAVIAVVCMVIVGLPVYYTFRAVSYPFASRIEDVGLQSDYWESRTTLLALVDGIRLRTAESLMRLFHKPEHVLYYAGDTPYIHYVLTPFVALGFASLLWRFWQPQRALILMWAWLPFAGIILLLAEIMSPRTTVFQPALAVMAALGVFYGLRGVFSTHPRLLKWMMVGVVTGLCLVQTVYYFSFHLPRFREQLYLMQPWQQFIFQTRLLPRQSSMHVVTTPKTDQPYLYQVIRFITNYEDLRLDTYLPEEITPEFLASLERDRPHAFIVQMPNAELDRLLRDTYPDLVGPILDSEWDVVNGWFVMYIVPEMPFRADIYAPGFAVMRCFRVNPIIPA
jgi:hypothetical protein